MTTATGQHGGLLARVIDARERSGEFAARHAPRGERSRRPDRAAVERQRVTRARRAVERVRANAPFPDAKRKPVLGVEGEVDGWAWVRPDTIG